MHSKDQTILLEFNKKLHITAILGHMLENIAAICAECDSLHCCTPCWRELGRSLIWQTTSNFKLAYLDQCPFNYFRIFQNVVNITSLYHYFPKSFKILVLTEMNIFEHVKSKSILSIVNMQRSILTMVLITSFN